MDRNYSIGIKLLEIQDDQLPKQRNRWPTVGLYLDISTLWKIKKVWINFLVSRKPSKSFISRYNFPLVPILDGNPEHVAHARRQIGLFGEEKKNPICDCSRSHPMP